MKKKIKQYKIEDGITQSILTNFLACRKRCRFELDGWESTRPRDALVFGSLWHDLLDKLYNNYRKGKDEIPFRKFEERWEKQNRDNISDPQKMEEMFAMAEALYDEYILYWQGDRKKIFKEIEGTFDIDFEGYRLRGRRDGMFGIKAKKTKRTSLWLMETKTTSGIMEDSMELKLAFDFQNLFYITALEHETKKDIAGVLYNVVVKPGHKLGTKNSPDIESYYDTLCQAISSDLKKYFRRYEIVYSRKKKERFKVMLRDILKEFRSFCDGEITALPSPENCVTRWSCEFLSACASDTMAGYLQTREQFRELQ